MRYIQYSVLTIITAIGLLLVSYTLEKDSDGYQLTDPLQIETRQQFFRQSTQLFLEDSDESRSFEPLVEMLNQVSSRESIVGLSLPHDSVSKQIAIKDSELAMLSAMAMTLPVNPAIDIAPQANVEIIESIKAIRQNNPIFQQGNLDVYVQDNDSHLLAYRLNYKNSNAYVIFNFSYDVHQAPMPLGFMASTKVQVWRTDNPELRTFVTNRPLSIRAFTAMVVIV